MQWEASRGKSLRWVYAIYQLMPSTTLCPSLRTGRELTLGIGSWYTSLQLRLLTIIKTTVQLFAVPRYLKVIYMPHRHIDKCEQKNEKKASRCFFRSSLRFQISPFASFWRLSICFESADPVSLHDECNLWGNYGINYWYEITIKIIMIKTVKDRNKRLHFFSV